ncbi:MAG TPA: bifunctional rhamnulose-1-phosphate aldolase/short-chain dehydrogenase [Planctomycetota bacterium]|nr:bifunctional rhamnulose-1-phosphate aldolase/short-chain dehydrogenase [Planctomycetota bacterium]
MTRARTIESRWDDAHAAGLSQEQLLIYRSNLLGSDLRVTNFGGGNTSAKVRTKDPLTGDDVEVLWVKGSGGDLGTSKLDGFASLYQAKLLALEQKYEGRAHEDAMPALYAHCTFNLNPRATSIDTPLHAFLPFRHVDHLHPDAVIALAAAQDGERATREIYGEEVGWLPWQRPGFDLGLKLREACRKNPRLQGIVLQNHGLIHWAETSKACYELALVLINRAIEYFDRKPAAAAFGGVQVAARGPAERRAFVAALMPALRGRLSKEARKVAHFDDSDDVLEFAGSKDAARLCAIGTSCPDHFLRTKIEPLLLEVGATTTPADVLAAVDPKLGDYVARYLAYYERCRRPDSPALRDPFPVVVMVPGIGLLAFSKDKAMARQAAEFWVNAIHVMKGAERVGGYVGLPEKEAFGIEYWQLEEAKLKRLPPERALSRRVALVTGGAGGIGKATARRLLQDGAAVVLTDLDAPALAAADAELAKEFARDAVRSVVADVTKEAEVIAAVQSACADYGGLDVVVCCAGLASAAPFEETSLAIWQKNVDVLLTGYFLFAREGYRVMKTQGLGGSIVFVASKNALAASPQAAAYCTAKAAELHLARCLALEGAEHGIRVNSVNPDAVLRGSKIWQGDWRRERAAAYGVQEADLEEVYRKRSLLKRDVFPEDVAEAIAFFASERSGKSTGNLLNVDAGNPQAFPR